MKSDGKHQGVRERGVMRIFRREIIILNTKDKDLGRDRKEVNRKLGWGQLESNHYNLRKEPIRRDGMIRDTLSSLVETTVNTYGKHKRILQFTDLGFPLNLYF